MSLSNDERKIGIIHAVNNLYKLHKEFKNHGTLRRKLRGLWAKFLRKTSNSTHWVFGSDTAAERFKNVTLLSASFESFVEDHSERGTVTTDYFYDRLRKNDPAHADFLEFMRDFKPDAAKLLSYENDELDKMWEAVRWIEHYFYYVNRYNDEFAKEHGRLTDSICEIRGILFDKMQTDHNFCRAWMMAKIIDCVVVEKLKDVVAQVFKKHCFHHGVRLSGLDPKETIEKFKLAREGKLKSANDRMLLLAKILGHRNHYEHVHANIIKIVLDWNKKNKKDQINVVELKKTFAESIKQHKDKEADDNERYERNNYCCLVPHQMQQPNISSLKG